MIQQKIFGLEISVHDTLPVAVTDSWEELFEKVPSLSFGKAFPRDVIKQLSSLGKLLNDVLEIPFFAWVVQHVITIMDDFRNMIMFQPFSLKHGSLSNKLNIIIFLHNFDSTKFANFIFCSINFIASSIPEQVAQNISVIFGFDKSFVHI